MLGCTKEGKETWQAEAWFKYHLNSTPSHESTPKQYQFASAVSNSPEDALEVMCLFMANRLSSWMNIIEAI